MQQMIGVSPTSNDSGIVIDELATVVDVINHNPVRFFILFSTSLFRISVERGFFGLLFREVNHSSRFWIDEGGKLETYMQGH